MTRAAHRAPAPASPWLAGAALVGAAGLAAATWGIGIERHLYTLRRHELAILPEGSPRLTVLHLSDAHMAPWQRRKQRWIAALADEVRPDLVIDTGDNLGHVDGITGIRAALAPFAGVPGVFVHGSNDMFEPSARNPLRYFEGPSRRRVRAERLDTAALERHFVDDLGWHDLNNAATTLEIAGLRIDAFGTGDAHHSDDDLDALPGALAALPAGDPAVRLGVTHAPYRRILDALVDLGADALLAGHTHGGQVRIPLSPAALVANCDIPLHQARGLSTWTHAGRTVPLNVSAGLGHSIYAPVRFGCRPEASVLTLVPRFGIGGRTG